MRRVTAVKTMTGLGAKISQFGDCPQTAGGSAPYEPPPFTLDSDAIGRPRGGPRRAKFSGEEQTSAKEWL
jgi:hypothetical protein